MSLALADTWRLAGCTDACWPRSHDPEVHELYGREMERELTRREQQLPIVVRTGALVIDRDAFTVDLGSSRLHLTGNQWRLLDYLAAHVGKVCRHDEIVAAVWGKHAVDKRCGRRSGGGFVRYDRHTLRVLMARLRVKLGPAADLIVTVVPHGYKLELRPHDD